jgi:hypothetical protein
MQHRSGRTMFEREHVEIDEIVDVDEALPNASGA